MPTPEGVISTSTGPVEPEVIEEEVIPLDEEVVDE
jgi:hypothetical protein